jgi:hypothetical protein
MEFSQPNLGSGAKRFYLSKRRDPQGQSLQYLYGWTPAENKARLEKIELATQQSADPANPTSTVPGIVFEYATANDLKISQASHRSLKSSALTEGGKRLDLECNVKINTHARHSASTPPHQCSWADAQVHSA